ncbi:MAG: LLM class flavin-dependent oxidoreductase [Chloroflexi bacterium]|nr:LLM class flavin-dependent oxidoreductase [Chloroflexota bacterium]
MKYGFVMPFADARAAADLARDAERAGWDGFFVWEPVWGVDAWVSLAAAAMQTERIRLGTMISPLSRMRPWKLAGETVAVDRLSNGRTILSVGLGAVDTGFAEFGEVTDRKARAELLDEGLDVLTGLWSGQPFKYAGKHYHVHELGFMPPPPPVQQPRIPIWVVGAWGSQKSMARALKFDGILPQVLDPKARQATVDEVRAIRDYVREHRSPDSPFDIIVEGETPGDDLARAAAQVQPWAAAGATWWIESRWMANDQPDVYGVVQRRIAQGPPGK